MSIKPFTIFTQLSLALVSISCVKSSKEVNAKSLESNPIDYNSLEVIQGDGHKYEYEPTWESLDNRPLPHWYDRSKIGIFVIWGVYSVPAFGSEWFWQNWKGKSQDYAEFMEKNYPPNFTYQEFAPQLTAEFFNATEWAQLFQKSGAKYVVLTGKHHEGYTLWPSHYSFSWNSMDVGPHRDLVGELASSVRTETDLKFGLYHSLYEWFNPLWLSDRNNSFATQEFVDFKTLPELYEITNKYKPEIIWSDGEWEADDSYWKSKEYLAWLYNESPVRDTVVTNDRWGTGTLCKHGGYYTCQDRFNPGVLQRHKWENCNTLDKKSWSYRRNAAIADYLTPGDLIKMLVETVACGGNLLLSVGPTREGTIPPIQQERLLQLGTWLAINGEAIYETVPWKAQNDSLTPGVWYTSRTSENLLYAISLNWPTSDTLQLTLVDFHTVAKIKLLGYSGAVPWINMTKGIQVTLPKIENYNFTGNITIDQLLAQPATFINDLPNSAGLGHECNPSNQGPCMDALAECAESYMYGSGESVGKRCIYPTKREPGTLGLTGVPITGIQVQPVLTMCFLKEKEVCSDQGTFFKGRLEPEDLLTNQAVWDARGSTPNPALSVWPVTIRPAKDWSCWSGVCGPDGKCEAGKNDRVSHFVLNFGPTTTTSPRPTEEPHRAAGLGVKLKALSTFSLALIIGSLLIGSSFPVYNY